MKLTNDFYNKHSPELGRYLFLFLFLVYSFPIYAETTVTVGSANDMLANIAKQIPQFMQLITAIAYVMGMMFVFKGIVEFKHHGEMRTQMSADRSIKTPIVYLIVGALLLYLPSSVQVGMSTFWSQPNPYGYIQEKDQWSQFISDCFLVVQLFGTIAFIRGLVILGHTGGGHAQQGQFAKGVTHIVGGIFCINIYQFVQVVLVTLGIQTS